MPTRVTAMLVRGEDTYGHFDDERRPRAEAGAGGARLPRRRPSTLFRQANVEHDREYRHRSSAER